MKIFSRNFCSQGALCLVRLPQFRLRFIRHVDSNRSNFVFIYAYNVRYMGSQETRPVIRVLDLEGIALG
jgi:hypothetical protein